MSRKHKSGIRDLSIEDVEEAMRGTMTPDRNPDVAAVLRVPVPRIPVGETILWCGRPLRVEEVLCGRVSRAKKGRVFVVVVDGKRRHLHYFDHESVLVQP